MLIAGRALQGLGGALVSPAALSVITTTFAEGRDRTRALGIWSGIAAGGGPAGLLLGGILTDVASWQWVFIVNVPVGAVALLLSLRLIPESRIQSARRLLDVGGAVLVTGGLMVAVYAIVQAQAVGWGASRTIGLGALAVVLLAAFVVVESRISAPLMPLRLFRIRSLSGSDSAMFVAAAGPITLMATTGLSADDAGLASGLLNTAQQVGGALGLAILSTIATARTSGTPGSLGHTPSRLEVAGAEVDGFRLPSSRRR